MFSLGGSDGPVYPYHTLNLQKGLGPSDFPDDSSFLGHMHIYSLTLEVGEMVCGLVCGPVCNGHG